MINNPLVRVLACLVLLIWPVYEMVSMYWGIILFPVAIALAAVIYLVAHDFLFRIFSSENDVGPLVATRPTQDLMGGAALFLALLLIAMSNRMLLITSEPITAAVTKKVMWKSAKQSCAEIRLQDNSTHCVDMPCWNRTSIGDFITLTPQAGLFGLRKMKITCQVTNVAIN